MEDGDIDYFISLVNMPIKYYIVVAMVWIIVIIPSTQFRGFKYGTLLSILCMYCTFLLCSAVFARNGGLRLDGVQLRPFWSYREIINGLC